MATRTDGGPVTVPSFEALADTAPAALVVFDRHGSCAWCNRAWSELTGATAADGDRWLSALHPDDRGRVARFVQRNVEFETELRLLQPDGKYRLMLARGAVHTGVDGTFVGYVVSANDVTQWGENTRLLQFFAALGEVLSSSLTLEGGIL